MSEPLVTICIPTYNSESTISATLDSLLAQKYSNLKIKIFDNCSKDNTEKVLANYSVKYSNISFSVNQNNLGAEENFTKCIQGCEGKYSAVFHADDIYTPEMIARQVEVLENDSEIVAVSTHAFEIDMNEMVIGNRLLLPEFKGKAVIVLNFDELLILILKYANFITCPSVMVKTDIYKNKIKFWNGADFQTSADLDVWLRLAKEGKFAFITAPLIKYRVSPASFSYNLAKVRIYRHHIFKVLEYYTRGIHLSATEKRNLEFLNFKDNVFRAYNIIRNRNYKEGLPKFNPFSFKVFICGFQSLFHFRIYVSGIICFVISLGFRLRSFFA